MNKIIHSRANRFLTVANLPLKVQNHIYIYKYLHFILSIHTRVKFTCKYFTEWQCRLDPLNVSDLMGHAAPEWAARHELSAGALLGKSCQGALMLAKQSRDMQKLVRNTFFHS